LTDHDEQGGQEQAGSDTLLRRCAGGDRAAFRMLYDRHAPRLYAVALRITRQASPASDAVQEAFIQVWRNAAQFDGARGTAEAWMTGLVRYRALDLLRRGGPPTESLDDAPERADAMALTALDQQADGRALRQCLERLDPDRRRLVVLAFVEGFSHAELSTRLATPLGTVKSSIRRALTSLRECLAA
jgi:RNA polymerase sigma-70 factor (ECF subfamily)